MYEPPGISHGTSQRAPSLLYSRRPLGWLPVSLAALRAAEWSREPRSGYNLAQRPRPSGIARRHIMKRFLIACVMVGALAGSAATLLAHHSFAAEFDDKHSSWEDGLLGGWGCPQFT